MASVGNGGDWIPMGIPFPGQCSSHGNPVGMELISGF